MGNKIFIHITRMTMHLFNSAYLLLYIALMGSAHASNQVKAHNSGIIRNINIENIQSRSLLLLLSNYNETNLIIGSEFKNRRINVKYDSIEINVLIEKIIRGQGLSFRRVDDILLVASECRLNTPPGKFDARLYDKKMSLNYMSVSVGALISAFETVTNHSINTSTINTKTPVTISSRERSTAKFIDIIATVQGLTILNNTDNTVEITENPRASKCPKPDSYEQALKNDLYSSSYELDCPDNLLAPDRPCDPLEHFELEDITVPGFINELSLNSYTAVLQAKDNQVYLTNAGDYIGRNEGEIIDIDNNKSTVDIIEIVPDYFIGYIEHQATLNMGIRYEDPRDKIIRLHTAPVKETQTQKEFLHAARKNNLKKMKTLISNADINASYKIEGSNALHFAVVNEYYEMAEWLISNGANVNNLVRKPRMSALIIASITGSTGMVNLLINAGADIQLIDAKNHTPIWWASTSGHAEIVKQLLNSGANPEKYNYRGLNSLTEAAGHGYKEIISIFLNAGYDINYRDRNGHTMLSMAVLSGHKSITKMLIESGADKSLKYKRYGSILDIATSRKHTEIADYLMSKNVPRLGKKSE